MDSSFGTFHTSHTVVQDTHTFTIDIPYRASRAGLRFVVTRGGGASAMDDPEALPGAVEGVGRDPRGDQLG
jgi:hypothetical protein